MPNHFHLLFKTGKVPISTVQKFSWQRISAVLALFSDRIAEARRLYLQFVKAGIDQGSRPDLTGGGLIRSSGGWAVVKSLRKPVSGLKVMNAF